MNFLPPPNVMNQIANEYIQKGTREWDRDEEMRKAEDELQPYKVADDTYQVNLEGYYPNVSYGVKEHLKKLIYKINFIQWKYDRQEFESWKYIDEIDELKGICKDLYNRIPLNQRPPPPF